MVDIIYLNSSTKDKVFRRSNERPHIDFYIIQFTNLSFEYLEPKPFKIIDKNLKNFNFRSSIHIWQPVLVSVLGVAFWGTPKPPKGGEFPGPRPLLLFPLWRGVAFVTSGTPPPAICDTRLWGSRPEMRGTTWNENPLDGIGKYFTVWKNEKFTLIEKIFRQIPYLVLSLVKTLLWRNFCQKSVRVNFRNFHTVLHNFSFFFVVLQKFREIKAEEFYSQKFRQIS